MITETDKHGNTHYYVDSIRPAAIKQYSRNAKIWYLFGKKHKLDGPAVIHVNGDTEYWQYGKRHREDGPAVKYINTRYTSNLYYLCGIGYDYSVYLKLIKLNKL